MITNSMPTLTRNDLLHPELSYKVVGAVYHVYNTLGYGYQERYYQRALVQELADRGLAAQREVHVPIQFKGRTIGRYFIDFVIEEKVALELKVANEFYESHVSQVLAYLRSAGLRLGILACFGVKGIRYKRLIV